MQHGGTCPGSLVKDLSKYPAIGLAALAVGAANGGPSIEKHQTVMMVTGPDSDCEYFKPTTNQSLKDKSAFSGGTHD